MLAIWALSNERPVSWHMFRFVMTFTNNARHRATPTKRAIAIWLGSTGNGRNPMFNGRRQPSCGGTSRMTREYQVRFCERLGVKFPGPTRQLHALPRRSIAVRFTSMSRPRQDGLNATLCAKALNRFAIVAAVARPERYPQGRDCG